MKIGFFCYDLHSKAPSIRARTLIEELEKQGYKPKVFTSQRDTDVKASEVYVIKLSNIFKIFKQLNTLDVVHVPINFFQALLVRIFYTGPITLDVGIQQSKLFRLLTKVLIKPLVVVKPSQTSSNEWLEDGVKSMFLFPPRDWSNFTKYSKKLIKKLRSEMCYPGTDKVVLYVGRLNTFKGIHILREVAEKLPQYKFIVIGGYEHKKKENVAYLGHIKNSELPKYYNIADVTLVPNLRGNDGGAVAMESVACGTPVINTMYCRELYSEIEKCYIWCKRDSEVIAKELSNLFQEPKRLNKTKKESQIIKTVYPSIEYFGYKYVKLFEEIVRESPSQSLRC